MTDEPIRARLLVPLRPWAAPNFATSTDPADSKGIPVSQLDPDSLADLAMAWLTDLYVKAGKTCPFTHPGRGR